MSRFIAATAGKAAQSCTKLQNPTASRNHWAHLTLQQYEVGCQPADSRKGFPVQEALRSAGLLRLLYAGLAEGVAAWKNKGSVLVIIEVVAAYAAFVCTPHHSVRS
jgi:predicted RNase H-like nuclease